MATKREKWLALYLDDKNPRSFLNAAGAAREAGYQSKDPDGFRKIGYRNKKHFEPQLVEWIEENGLSEFSLKLKLASLLDAKETKFFQKDGKVIETKEVEALGIQRQTLDMAMKMKGMYAPEEHNINATIEDKREALARAQKRLEEIREEKEE